jgi:hypothetical protein
LGLFCESICRIHFMVCFVSFPYSWKSIFHVQHQWIRFPTTP